MILPDDYIPGVNVKDGFFLYQQYPKTGFKKDIGGQWVDAPRPEKLADSPFDWSVFSETDDFTDDVVKKIEKRLREGMWIFSRRFYYARRIQEFIDSYKTEAR